MNSNKDLIVVKQLPLIEENLKQLSVEIDEKVKNAKSLICTEETVKEVKQVRADLNKEFKELETQRKLVKEQILAPYMNFEEIYKQYVSDKYRNADMELKNKVDSTENELKVKKEKEIKDYFEEYKVASNIDFITYGQARINVTLSASVKNLKEQAKQFIDKIVDDLKLIETQEHKAEILVEYKQILNVSNAITSVTNKFKAIEEEKKKIEQEKELQKFILDTAKESDKYSEQTILNAPVIEEKAEEILILKFTVRGTRNQLRELKQFLVNGGYEYE